MKRLTIRLTQLLLIIAVGLLIVGNVYCLKNKDFNCGEPVREEYRDEGFIARQEPEPQHAAKIVVSVNGKQKDLTKAGNIVCEVGELIRIDLRESTVCGLAWRVLPGTKDFEVIESGKRAFFSSRRSGKYLVIIGGAKEDHAYLEHFHIVIEGPAGEPIVRSLADDVEEWFTRVEDYETRQQHAEAVAKVFSKIADQEDVEVDKILEATALANSAVLGEDLERWKPFLDELGSKLDDFDEGGKLNSRNDYQSVWHDIAAGIERGL